MCVCLYVFDQATHSLLADCLPLSEPVLPGVPRSVREAGRRWDSCRLASTATTHTHTTLHALLALLHSPAVVTAPHIAARAPGSRALSTRLNKGGRESADKRLEQGLPVFCRCTSSSQFLQRVGNVQRRGKRCERRCLCRCTVPVAPSHPRRGVYPKLLKCLSKQVVHLWSMSTDVRGCSPGPARG